jgi:hypothetical protein
MELFLFFVVLLVIFAGGGWAIGKSIGNLLFTSEKEKKITFIDNSIHHHHHDHKHISLIDEKTKEVIKDYILYSKEKAPN